MISTATSWASGWSRSCGSSAVSYLPVEHARDRLVAIVQPIELFPVHPEGLHRHVVVRAAGDRGEPAERLFGARPLVIEQRRERARRSLPGRTKLTEPVPALGVSHGALDVLGVLGERFVERRFHLGHEWEIEAVEPDHRLVALVAMVVPPPRRGRRANPSAPYVL